MSVYTKLVILSSRITSLRVQQAGALIKMETLNYMANFTLTVASLHLTVPITLSSSTGMG